MARINDRQAASIHEAAHGVIGMRVGMEVSGLEIYSRDGGSWGGWVLWKAPSDVSTIDVASAFLAGEIAAFVVGGLPVDLRAREMSGDIAQVARLLGIDAPYMSHLDALDRLSRHSNFAPLLARTIADVRSEVESIVRVAQLLMEKERITGYEAYEARMAAEGR